MAVYPNGVAAFQRHNIESAAMKSAFGSSLWTELSRKAVVEQYTGLKDKNGKEIYEGDIVKVRPISEDSDFCAMIAPVTYYKYKYCLDSRGATSRGWSFHYESRFVEVIGNVHENPELLEGEK